MDIYDLVSEFQRLDSVGADGYVAHEGDDQEWPTIGFVDHAVVSVHPQDIGSFIECLSKYPEGTANLSGSASLMYEPQKATQHLRCKWHI